MKIGFAYYNVDTDRYQDIRIKRLKKEFSGNGIAVYDYILCEIYRVRGCYLEWDESTVFGVAEYFGLKETMVTEIVNYCCNVGLFNKELRASGSVLTSSSIQRRFTEMCKRAKRDVIIPEEIRIIPEESPKIREKTPKLPEEIVQKKSRVKKKKDPLLIPPPGSEIGKISFDDLWDLYDKKIGDRDKLRKKWDTLPLKTQEAIIAYIPHYKQAQPDKQYRKNLQTFLNGKAWNDEIIKKQNYGNQRQHTTALERDRSDFGQ